MAPDSLVRELPAHLDRWVASGLLAPEQADCILWSEQTSRGAGRSSGSLATEALGYVGGVLVLVAALALLTDSWSDLPLGGRVVLGATATVLLLAAGAALPDRRSATGRLRSMCWLLVVVALTGTIHLIGDEVLILSPAGGSVLAAAVAALAAGALWWAHSTVVQQAVFVAATVTLAMTTTAALPQAGAELTGLAAWGTGAVWVVLGVGAAVPAARTAVVFGGLAVVLGGFLLIDASWGPVLAVLSAVAFVAGGVLLRDLRLLVVGSVATLVTGPSIVWRYFPDTLAAPFALLAIGMVLVAGALWTARRGGRGPATWYAVPRGVAGPVAALLAAVVAVAVLVAGLLPA